MDIHIERPRREIVRVLNIGFLVLSLIRLHLGVGFCPCHYIHKLRFAGCFWGHFYHNLAVTHYSDPVRQGRDYRKLNGAK